jgi:putative DNA primase/helicase
MSVNIGTLLNQAQPSHPLIQKYLKSRGISIPSPSSMELHPRVEYFEVEDNMGIGGEHFPAILTRFMLGDEMTGIQKTYLREDGSGKADIPDPKKFQKCAESLKGSAIRLLEAKPNSPLILSEGIETGLAVNEATGWPVWACGAANLLECVQLPENVQTVYIAADLDRSETGEKAAKKLAHRLRSEGKKVHIVMPSGPIPEGAKSVDWLDVLNQGGEK